MTNTDTKQAALELTKDMLELLGQVRCDALHGSDLIEPMSGDARGAFKAAEAAIVNAIDLLHKVRKEIEADAR